MFNRFSNFKAFTRHILTDFRTLVTFVEQSRRLLTITCVDTTSVFKHRTVQHQTGKNVDKFRWFNLQELISDKCVCLTCISHSKHYFPLPIST